MLPHVDTTRTSRPNSDQRKGGDACYALDRVWVAYLRALNPRARTRFSGRSLLRRRASTLHPSAAIQTMAELVALGPRSTRHPQPPLSFAFPAAGASDAGASSAGASGPGVGAAIAGIPETTTPVRWVCGPYRCRWRAGWRGPVRPWAVWGPPRFPGCYYEKRRGAWIEVCVYPG